jgi:hypothetical protein
MSQNGKKGCRKHQDMMSQRVKTDTMGQNVSIFMGKMDVKYIRLKCSYGTKCHIVGLAKNAVDGMVTCGISPPKNVENEKFRDA